MKRALCGLCFLGFLVPLSGCPDMGMMDGDDMTDAGGMMDDMTDGVDMMDDMMARGLTASLTGDQEAPTVVTDATGTGTFTLSADRMSLMFEVTASDFASDVVAQHFHNAPSGISGPIVFDLAPFRTIVDGVLTISGTTQLSDWSIDSAATEILSGNIYVNIHTVDNGPGEIRGQLLLDESGQPAGESPDAG